MGLGIYMDNISDGEDVGVPITEDMQDTFTPDFKNRHTIQRWVPTVSTTDIKTAFSLVESSSHEIKIKNELSIDVTLKFSPDYILLDEDIQGNSLIIEPNKTAYFYATGLQKDGLKLVMRTGSQDNRDK